MNEEDSFKNQLDKLEYNIAHARNNMLNLHKGSLSSLSKEVVENAEKELDDISHSIESNLENASSVATDELYSLKDETKSIGYRLAQMLAQIEQVEEINASLLELIEMKDAALEQEKRHS